MVVRCSVRASLIRGCKEFGTHIVQFDCGCQWGADHPQPVEFRAQPTIEAHRSEWQPKSEYSSGNSQRSLPRAGVTPCFCMPGRHALQGFSPANTIAIIDGVDATNLNQLQPHFFRATKRKQLIREPILARNKKFTQPITQPLA